jgi:hypothetical protein
MKLLEISPDDLDLKDERFRFSYHFDPGKLLQSINKIGIVCPLVVVKRDDPRFVILSGWKRVLSCIELSFRAIPVFLLQEDDDCRAFLFSLYENLAIRNFNILEKAGILHLLDGFIKDEKKIVKQFFPLLDIPATLSYLDIYLKIARLDPVWKKMIFDKKMPLTAVKLLTEFTPQDKEKLFPLILPLSLNKLKQFMEDLFELSKKTGRSPGTLLSMPEIQAVFQDDNLSSLQKAERIRSILRTKRYPTLSSWKKSFDASLRKARLSKEVAFDAPSFFEDGEFAVTFSLKNKEDFQKRLAKLRDLASDEDLFLVYKRFIDG